MAGELASLATRLASIVDPAAQRRIATKAGLAAEKAALDAAAHDLGGDRRFSKMRGGGALGASLDVQGSKATVNLHPAGLWALAEQGRRRTKRVTRVGQKGPFLTPQGVRSAFTSGPSRGLHTISDANRDSRRDTPRAADLQVQTEIRKALH